MSEIGKNTVPSLFSCAISLFCVISLSSHVLPYFSCALSFFSSVLSLFSPVLSLIFSMLSFVLTPGLPLLINILHKELNVNIPEHGSVEIFDVNLDQTSTALILIRKHSLLFYLLLVLLFKMLIVLFHVIVLFSSF